MYDKNRLILKSILLGMCIFFVSCGDPATQAFGKVFDKNGNPIQDVSVLMESNEKPDSPKVSEQKTKPDGSFSFIEITAPATKVKLIFKKDGFNTIELEITPNKENKRDIVLEPEMK